MGLLRVAVVLLSASVAVALDNGLAQTPPMGWNSWNTFGGNIDEELIKATADRMVSLGLAEAGYNYLNLDDGWHLPTRDDQGRMVPDPARFPSGLATLGDYIHSHGLQFGIYSDAGLHTCMGLPGSLHHEEVDAATFASWGVDYLKYDNCFASPADWVVDRYTAMRDALNATGRSIFFSMCEWGVAEPWLWADTVGNSWRTTDDIANDWEDVLRCLDETVGLSQFAGAGHWNDPDMLEVGNGRLTHGEERAHFALWALLKAPLLIGADLRHIGEPSLSVLLSTEVIAVNQDRLGVAGELIWKQGALEAYAAPLEGGRRAAVLFNRHALGSQYKTSNITLHWEQVGYPPELNCTVRDLYSSKDLGIFSGSFTAAVGLHDVAAVSLTPVTGGSGSNLDSWRPWEGSSMYRRNDMPSTPQQQVRGAAEAAAQR